MLKILCKVDIRTYVLLLFTCVAMTEAKAMSRFREESYQPNVLQREGLALLRIVGSPAALITEGEQFYEEYSAACGKKMPFSFLTGSVIGCFVMGFEIIGGTVELISFQQIKSWAYPWEFDEPDQESIARMREDMENESSDDGDFVADVVGAAVGAAVEESMNKGSRRSGRNVTTSGGGGASKSKAKPRVRHSSCGGTGTCPI